MQKPPEPLSWPALVRATGAAALACLLASTPSGGRLLADVADAPQGSTRAGIESTRSTLAKWVETRKIIAREKKEWQAGKDVLEQRIALMNREIAEIEEKISEARRSLGDVDTKRRELVGRAGQAEAVSTALRSGIDTLETGTLRLIASLPDPIRTRISPLSHRIPTDPADTKQSLSERFQNVIGILNEVNKFDREVTVTSEIRPAGPAGGTAEVKAIYLGLGQAYYVTVNGAAAAVGRPGPNGWEWTPANELAGDIARAIEILQGEEVPAFVPLPVRIQ